MAFLDPEGGDVVYLNSKGEEVRRILSNTRFETWVQGKDGKYQFALMPNVMRFGDEHKISNPQYQRYDHIIAAQVWLFNHLELDELPSATNGVKLKEARPGDLNVHVVKAWLMAESSLGTGGKKAGTGSGNTDLAQVNVPGDWAGDKTVIGLREGQKLTPTESIYYGLRWLFVKGLTSTVDKKGVVTVHWDHKRGFVGEWESSIRKYNGGGSLKYNHDYMEEVRRYLHLQENKAEPSVLDYRSAEDAKTVKEDAVGKFGNGLVTGP